MPASGKRVRAVLSRHSLEGASQQAALRLVDNIANILGKKGAVLICWRIYELSCQDTALKERHSKPRLDSSTEITSLERREPSCYCWRIFKLSCHQDTALKERHSKLRLDSSTILPTSWARREPSCSVGASMNFPVKTQP